jgi:hypothetical protein
MLKQTALCVLLGVAGALPACGSASDNDFSGPAAAGSAMKGGSSGSSGSTASGGSSGNSGATGKGGTSSSMGGSGGSGGGTGGTGGSDVGGTGMGGSATQGGSSGDAATGGTGMATGGTDPGVGGTDPGVGGTDPGMGGTGMMTGGAGGMGGKGGNGGSAGTANCDELTMQYADALAAARACNAESGKDQCTDTMPGSLTCGCDVFVNPDNEEAVAELRRLRKAGASCSMVCPAIACINPGPAECGADRASDGLCRRIGAILQ